MTWHRFVASSDNDNECSQPNCGVIVSDDALRTYAAPCPAPPCGDAGNGGPCVFVPGEHGPVCAYCERPGHLAEPDEDDDDVDLDEPAAA